MYVLYFKMINDFAPDSFHDVILTIIRCFTMDLAKRVLWWGSVWDQLSRFKQNQSVTCYCVRVHSVMCDLLTWGNNLYHGIISLRGDVRVHDTITSPLFLLHTFFYWGAVTKPGKRTVMHMSVTGNVTILPLPTILIFYFEIVLTVWYIFEHFSNNHLLDVV